MSINEEFARAAERLTLAKEIKRQERNLAAATAIIEAKRARLAHLEAIERRENARKALENVAKDLDGADLDARIIAARRAVFSGDRSRAGVAS